MRAFAKSWRREDLEESPEGMLARREPNQDYGRDGHRSLEMLETYSRDAEAFVGHAGAGLL
jgi:hypothetical protein